MKKTFLLIALLSTNLFLFAQRNITIQVNDLPDHPRILLLKGEEESVKQIIASDKCWKEIHQLILAESDKIIDMPCLERKQVGRRLLGVSRKALQRIFFLSYSYRTTGKSRYAKRAEEEMLAVSSFSNWNPSHFLDVGEMTMALAIGYDWLNNQLSPESKEIIRSAIVEKGIKPSMDEKSNRFLKMTNNWNQVCNAGITYGSLAIAEDEPQLAKEMIERALNNMYMEEYSPDGVYPEGAGYWSYGTSFNVMFLSAIEKVFGKDFGLSETQGFKQTAAYAQNMIAPDNRVFTYSDTGGNGKVGLNTTLFWFAQKYKDISILWMQKENLNSVDESIVGNRLLPAIMVWGRGVTVKKITPPEQLMFSGQGHAPVSLMRTSWTDPKAIYLGYKLGSPQVSHAHMDIGSFMVVANGVRWATDFGMQNYESLESKGIKLFDRAQDGPRWKIFRYNNMAHNTLTFDNQLQNVKGYADLKETFQNGKIMFAVSDLTDLYKDQVKTVTRGVAIVNKEYVTVRDEIKTLPKKTTIRWNMLTGTKVQISGNTAILKAKTGEELLLRIDYPVDAKVRTWSTVSPNSYDESNKGTIFVGFEYEAPENTSIVLQVSLIPNINKKKEATFDKNLDQWKSF